MEQELEALELNHTWDLTTLPVGKKAIGNKWVFKVKMKPDGSVERYKARLMAKGYHQVQGAFGLTQSAHDHCLFVRSTSTSFLALLIYVDDVLITGSSGSDIAALKQHLDKLFTIKDLGTAKYFLGLEIARTDQGTFLNQRKYILDLLHDAGMLQCKPTSMPFPQGLRLAGKEGTPLVDAEQYRRIVGRLLYLNLTRADITYVVQQLSQFVNDPYTTHWDAAMHLLRYLKGCPSLGLFYSSSSPLTLKAYCDADWGYCSDTRKSLTGYCVFLGSSLVSWKTKKHSTVSPSTTEAEYRALSTTICELLWLSYLVQDFHVPLSLLIPLWCDNQAALHIVANPDFHERTKHLDIDCHVVRNQYKAGFVAPCKISSQLQLADVFTKLQGKGVFQELLCKLGMSDFHRGPT
ncbi:hypothetical protein DH2020_006388 [Rehmannia glutinosa]|uniref:Reverse transcriptase Ty1/copia-type domain-containing protein n=1 Tax=Rehmannia glutinosa TaxID=99300 RepID=A0ABR0XIS1_REHGL